MQNKIHPEANMMWDLIIPLQRMQVNQRALLNTSLWIGAKKKKALRQCPLLWVDGLS